MEQNEFWTYLSAFLQPFLMIVLPPLAALLAGLALQGIRWIQAKIKNESPKAYEILSFIVGAAVMAAEQAEIAGLISEKKEFALQFAQERLKLYGLTLDTKLIMDEIEKAVYENINQPEKLLG